MGGAFTGYSLYAFLNTTKTYMVFRFWTPPGTNTGGFYCCCALHFTKN